MDAWITGGATLSAAAVSAGAAAAVTRWSLNKKHRLDAKEQQARLARDVATRFLNAVTDIETDRMVRMQSNTVAAAERNEALKQALLELLQTAKQNPEEAARMALELRKTISAAQSSPHVLRAVGDAMGGMDVMKKYIAEMQLIFPESLVKKAETVAAKAFGVSMLSELPQILQGTVPKDGLDLSNLGQLSAERDAAIKDFRDALRESFDLDKLTN